MITNAAITAILPVSDISRATAFYRDRLGLQDLGEADDGNHNLRAGSGTIGLMPAEPGAQSAHTVLSFEVDDVFREMRDLESHGVTFEDYDLPNIKTVEHVWTQGENKAAWFKDSEGNVLCLHEGPTP
jgi:catechol 2,3-dioxygenase-like lactoylglutathione lyase family enzyme